MAGTGHIPRLHKAVAVGLRAGRPSGGGLEWALPRLAFPPRGATPHKENRPMRQLTVLGLTLALFFSTALLAQKKPKEVFTDPNDADIPADFKFQGEYAPAKS